MSENIPKKIDKERSVFDRLDSIENLLEDFVKQQPVPQSSDTKPQISDQQILNNFIKSSKKEHLWFGSLNDFNKSKKLVYILSALLIITGVISTILTSIAFKLYSTFSLFENIWLVFACIMLSYSIYAKKRMADTDLRDHSCNIFMQDADGTWRNTNKEKKRFRWLRRISYVAVIANIIVILTQSKGVIAISATIFELVFAGLTIGLYFAYINLFCMYGTFILFTGRNSNNTQNVTLVFDVIGKKLLSYEEFKKTMKDFI